MKINILSQDYEIIKEKESKRMDMLKSDGLCEFYTKEIYINNFEEADDKILNPEEYKRKVLRHEIIHAFLFESGLDSNSDWARNEEMVDFFAIQFPKLMKAFKDAEVI